MKKSFLIIAIAAVSYASAQENGLPYLQKKIQKPMTVNPGVPQFFDLNHPPDLLAQARLSHTLLNGNKVYLLPQDNMPCVVPDMSQYNNMPLAKPDMPQFYNIPNPAYPPQSKIEPLILQKLKELREHPEKR